MRAAASAVLWGHAMHTPVVFRSCAASATMTARRF